MASRVGWHTGTATMTNGSEWRGATDTTSRGHSWTGREK